MSDGPHSVTDLYADYVRKRKAGRSMEDAARDLAQFVDHLDKSSRSELKLLVEQWEAREGLRVRTELAARLHTKSLSVSEPPKPPSSTPSSPPTPEPPHTPGGRSGSFVIRPLSPGKKKPDSESGGFSDSAPIGKQFCPKCGKPNNICDSYCYSCGHLLATARTTDTKDLLGDGSLSPDQRWGAAYFDSGARLVLMVREFRVPVLLTHNHDLTIGRASPDNRLAPDIDLSGFEAEECGVSRMHAALHRGEHTIHIKDLSSRNHTYVNNQRVYPQEVRVLRDGDIVRLGRMTLHIVFERG